MINRKRDSSGRFQKEHGDTKSKLYRVWCSMKERCTNPYNKSYSRYGERGISVCEEWANDYKSFRKWALESGYSDGLTIDRIDVNGNYEPSNCRFVTYHEQNRNYSKNHNLTYNGRTQCLSDWADEVGINRGTLLYRIKKGKTIEEALSTEDGRKTRWKTESI